VPQLVKLAAANLRLLDDSPHGRHEQLGIECESDMLVECGFLSNGTTPIATRLLRRPNRRSGCGRAMKWWRLRVKPSARSDIPAQGTAISRAALRRPLLLNDCARRELDLATSLMDPSTSDVAIRLAFYHNLTVRGCAGLRRSRPRVITFSPDVAETQGVA
jgi:hypothetical protein